MGTASARYFLSALEAGVSPITPIGWVPQRRRPPFPSPSIWPIGADVDAQTPGGGVQDKGLDSANGVVFVSAPLPKPTEMSGLFQRPPRIHREPARFRLRSSALRTPRRRRLFSARPLLVARQLRAGPEHRNLLVAGKRQSLDFRSVRLMCRGAVKSAGQSAWSRCSASSRSRDGKSIMERAGKSSQSRSPMPRRRCKSPGSAAAI